MAEAVLVLQATMNLTRPEAKMLTSSDHFFLICYCLCYWEILINLRSRTTAYYLCSQAFPRSITSSTKSHSGPSYYELIEANSFIKCSLYSHIASNIPSA